MEFIKTVANIITHNATKEYERYIGLLTKDKLNSYFRESTHELYKTDFETLIDFGSSYVDDFPKLPKECNIRIDISGICPSCEKQVNTNIICKSHGICGICCYIQDIDMICRDTGSCQFLAIDMYKRYHGNKNNIVNHIVECSEFGFLVDPGSIEWSILFEEERKKWSKGTQQQQKEKEEEMDSLK